MTFRTAREHAGCYKLFAQARSARAERRSSPRARAQRFRRAPQEEQPARRAGSATPARSRCSRVRAALCPAALRLQPGARRDGKDGLHKLPSPRLRQKRTHECARSPSCRKTITSLLQTSWRVEMPDIFGPLPEARTSAEGASRSAARAPPRSPARRLQARRARDARGGEG